MPSLNDIPASRVWKMQQRAAMRMQLYTIGATQSLLSAFQTRAADRIRRAGPSDQPMSHVEMHRIQGELEPEWIRTFTTYKKMFETLRRESASLPFGSLAVLHNRLIAPVAESVRPRSESRQLDEAAPVDFLFQPQLQTLLDVTRRRVYGDGLNLSARLWKLDKDSRDGINAVLYNGVANRRSAWDIAKSLEQYLGASAKCPRWTSTRLNQISKTDIAGGRTTGLYRGSDCDGQGVAFNALRLARNEIQTVHAEATDEIMAKQPWIEEEQIYLSSSHPEKDECDDIVNGGRDGKGIYPVGTIKLPIHVHCLCGKRAVQGSASEFTQRVKGWMRGTRRDAELDQYAQMLGRSGASFTDSFAKELLSSAVAGSLADWLWGNVSQLDQRTGFEL